MNQKLKFLCFWDIHNSLPSFWASLAYSGIKIDHIVDSLLKLQIKIGVHLINIELLQLQAYSGCIIRVKSPPPVVIGKIDCYVHLYSSPWLGTTPCMAGGCWAISKSGSLCRLYLLLFERVCKYLLDKQIVDRYLFCYQKITCMLWLSKR